MGSDAARIGRRYEIFLKWTRSILCLPRCMRWRGKSLRRRTAAKGSAQNSWRRRFAILELIRRNGTRLSARTKELTAPEGAVDFEELTASLKRCPDPNHHHFFSGR